jgi:hypothetical protein
MCVSPTRRRQQDADDRAGGTGGEERARDAGVAALRPACALGGARCRHEQAHGRRRSRRGRGTARKTQPVRGGGRKPAIDSAYVDVKLGFFCAGVSLIFCSKNV